MLSIHDGFTNRACSVYELCKVSVGQALLSRETSGHLHCNYDYFSASAAQSWAA